MIRTAQDMKTYRKRIQEALSDQFLRKALDNFNTAYRENRPNVYKGIDFDGIRDELASDKDAVLPRLQELFQQFKARAEAAGARIYTARTGDEANEIIAAIAKQNHVQKIIKSKSMTAEETFLNDRLEHDGYTVVETDLGEWIIQLRHEGPSHMVMPAIHLSRYQVGELFSQVTRQAQDAENIDKLVKVARNQLRQEFLTADMGVTGANFAVAQFGNLGMVSNEGNLRLVTTMPRIHVALVGYDKLIPDMKTALKILKLLPRNATGQAITSYVTWIKGPVEYFGDGDKQLHIVFLDNGRLELARDPVFAEALRCVRCGACANVCPVYSKIGGHKYGHVYIGAIGLILTLFYHGTENDRAIVRNCINCQACREVCPVAIDLPYLIKKTWKEVIRREGEAPLKNALVSRVMKNRKLFHFILRKAWLAQRPFAGRTQDTEAPMIRHLPHFFEKNHGFRSLPMIAKTPFRDRFRNYQTKVTGSRMTIGLFAGCAMDFIYPEQGEAFLELVAGRDIRVDFPEAQSCCGLPLMMMAEEDVARDLARQNIAAFAAHSPNYIVTLCASCGSHLKHNYDRLFRDDPNPPEKLKVFMEKVIDFSSFMVDVVGVSASEFSDVRTRVTYHAPCHLCRGLGVRQAPRELISRSGYTYVPCKDEEVCCGFGGSYSVDFPEISAEILKKKLDHVEATHADMLVTDCPGCVLQLRGGMDKRQRQIQVIHIAEAMAKTYRQ